MEQAGAICRSPDRDCIQERWLHTHMHRLSSTQQNKTVRDAYPLPRIEEALDALSNARLFTTQDLMLLAGRNGRGR